MGYGGPVKARNLLRNMMNGLGRVDDTIMLLQSRVHLVMLAQKEIALLCASKEDRTFQDRIVRRLIAQFTLVSFNRIFPPASWWHQIL